MGNAMHLALIIGPAYLVIGLSLLFYAEPWLKVIKNYEKDHLGMMVGALMSLILGLIVINMYNEWTWNGYLLITLTGWIMFIKGVFYFMAPGEWTKSLLKHMQCMNCVYLDGVICTVVGLYLSYMAYLI